MGGCANRSITELMRLMGLQCLAPEAEQNPWGRSFDTVSVTGSIPVATTQVILIAALDFRLY
jgi:hypothetical protein